MTITDIIALFLSLCLMFLGASRGFMNSLINPFSIIVTTCLSIVYYQAFNNLMISLLIGLLGPILLTLLLKFILNSWAKATNTDIKPGFFSCMGGAVLTLLWGWVFIIFALILFAAFPPLGKVLTAIHNDVTNSRSYIVLAKPLEYKFFTGPKENIAVTMDDNPTMEAKSLADDPRFQKILQDPAIQTDIKTHDFVKLMSNPKMMTLTKQIMSDPIMMKKVMAFYSKSLTQPQADAATSGSSP